MRKGKKIILGVCMSIATVTMILVIMGIRYLSFSKWNVYPRKEIERYLEEAYQGKFTYLRQDYLKSKEYHVWIVYFKDEKGREFAEYFYMRNTSEQLATYKRYGETWDTYASMHLEEKYGEWLIEQRYPVNLRRECPERHYIFFINEEEDIELVAEELAKLYDEVFLIGKLFPIISLKCEVRGKDGYRSLFSVAEVYGDNGKIEEQELREYFVYDLKNSMGEYELKQKK